MSTFLRLTRVELSRLLHRRAVLLILAAAVVVPTVIGIAVTLDTKPPSPDALADAEAQVEAERTSPEFKQMLRECVKTPASWSINAEPGSADAEQQCLEQNEPQLEWFLSNAQLDLAEQRDDGSGLAVALILGIGMMLLGTTFTGHDWSSGSVSNQLLFEPRRMRVWWAKAVVVTVVAFMASAVVMSGFWLALDATASSRDLPSGSGLLLDCLQMGWRTALVAALAALLGFAFTMLFRSTVATLGILFGVALAGGVVLGVLGVSDRWNPAINVAAVITDNTTYYVEVPCQGEIDDGSICSEERKLSMAGGAGFLGTAVVAAGALSLLSFRRRDVP